MLTALDEPYAPQAREILKLLRAKAPDSEIQALILSIHNDAITQGVTDPLVPSTDAYVTSICYLGSKSLSHVLSCIERCKERLLAIGPESEEARRQIIESVMQYWADKPGIGVNIVDKLLNYTILTPMSVLEWALVTKLDRGNILTSPHVYELISATIFKVSNRIRQIVIARNQQDLSKEQAAVLGETLEREKRQMAGLFALIEDSCMAVGAGSADQMIESEDLSSHADAMLRAWGRRWLRVFRRKNAVEQAWIAETLADRPKLVHGNGTAGDASMEGDEAEL